MDIPDRIAGKSRVALFFVSSFALLALGAGAVLAQPGDFILPLPPDYFQQRTGLPAMTEGVDVPVDGGAYCGPTSSADLLKGMNGRGFSLVGGWEEVDWVVTLYIAYLGALMDVDPNYGCGAEDVVSGLQSVLDDAYPYGFSVGYLGRRSADAYSRAEGREFRNIIDHLELGDFIVGNIGWYWLDPPAPNGDGTRCSGHFVFITGYDNFDGLNWVRFEDPCRDTDCVVTEPCVCRWGVSMETHYLQAYGQEVGDYPYDRVQASRWIWERSGSDCSNNETRTPIQDGFVWVSERSVFTENPGPKVKECKLASGAVNQHAAAMLDAISSLAIDINHINAYYCSPAFNSIYRTDLATDVVSTFVTDVPVYEPRTLAFGSRGRLYVLHTPSVSPYGVSAGQPAIPGMQGLPELIAFNPNGSVNCSVTLDGVGTFAYHEKTDRILWWNGLTNTIQVYTSDLQPIGTPFDLPPNGDFSLPAYMAADPRGDVLCYDHQGSDLVFRYDLLAHASLPPIADSSMTDPAGIVFDDKGEIVFDDKGEIYVAQEMTSPILHFSRTGARVLGSPVGSLEATRVLALKPKTRRMLPQSDLSNDLDNDAPIAYPTGVESPEHAVPGLPVVSVYPNPLNPSAFVRYDIPSAAVVTIKIFDSSGRLIRTLVDGAQAGAGPHRAYWDGRSDSGKPVASGVYFCRFQIGSNSTTKRMVLIR